MQLVLSARFFSFLSFSVFIFPKSQKLMMNCWIVSSYATWPPLLKKEDPFPGVFCLCKARSDIVISSSLNWLPMNKAKLVNCFLWGEFNEFHVEGQTITRWDPQKNSIFCFVFLKNILGNTVFYLMKITEFCQKLSSLLIFPISIRILKAVFNSF